MARLGILVGLEHRLAYSDLIRYRYVRPIAVNRRYILEADEYTEYLGALKHGWKINRRLCSYGTYELCKCVYYVNISTVRAKITGILKVKAPGHLIRFKWYRSPSWRCQAAGVVRAKTMGFEHGQPLVIKKHGKSYYTGVLPYKQRTLYELLSQIIRALRAEIRLSDPYK